MRPEISIVIPSFNCALYLEAAIESAICQVDVGIEVIVVNDGSTDDTEQVLSRYRDHPSVSIVEQANAGLPSARNAGLQRASGDYVGFLDADDLWDGTKARAHVRLMDAAPHIDLTYSWWRVIDRTGEFTGRKNTTPERRLPKGLSFRGLLVQNFAGNGSSVICRRSALAAVGGFDPTLRANEDLDTWLRIAALRANNIALVPQVLTSYRVHGTQITSDWRRMSASWNRVLDKAREIDAEAVASVERLARAKQSRYLAYIAYERKEYPEARALALMAWKGAPVQMSMDRRAWLTTAAALGSLLPQSLHERLADVARRTLKAGPQ